MTDIESMLVLHVVKVNIFWQFLMIVKKVIGWNARCIFYNAFCLEEFISHFAKYIQKCALRGSSFWSAINAISLKH